MNTTPRTGRSASPRTASTWPTISCARRLREKPSPPVAQNAQASAHPAWLETQTMYFFSLPAYALVSAPGASQGMGMRTASTCAPPSSSNRYFTKPSEAAWRRSTRIGAALVAESTASRTARRTPRTDRRSGSPRCTAAARSLRPTSSPIPSRSYCSGSIPQRCITGRVLPARSLEVDRHLQAVDGHRDVEGAPGCLPAVLHQQHVDVPVGLDEPRRGRGRRLEEVEPAPFEQAGSEGAPIRAVPDERLRAGHAGGVHRELRRGGLIDDGQAEGELREDPGD